MVEYLFWAGALVLLGIILAADYVVNRFRHTAKSRRVLAAEAVGAYAVSLGLVSLWLRPQRWLAGILWAGLAAVPLYLGAALVTVERWRRKKLAEFDRPIAQLRRELSRRREALDRLIWQIRELERRHRDAPTQPVRDPREEWWQRIETWQRSGAPRVRALKVEEWRQELKGLDREALAQRRKQLEEELRAAEGERREWLEVQWILVRLAEAPRGEEQQEDAGSLEEARRQREREERELRRLEAELEQWQRQRAAFVRQRISLD